MRVPHINIIAAIAENNVIGSNGALPFKLSTDLRRFKALTLGKPVIMGRKTFESIGKALPARTNIVISRSPFFSAENVISARSLDEAIRIGVASTMAHNDDAIYIIGGGEIYAQTMIRADHLLITHVEAVVEGDTVFPVIDPLRFVAGEAEYVAKGEHDSHASRFIVYKKRKD